MSLADKPNSYVSHWEKADIWPAASYRYCLQLNQGTQQG